MPMCTFCKATIPNPRVTREENIGGQPRSTRLPGEPKEYAPNTTRKWAYFTCPTCKRETCIVVIHEVVEENGKKA